MRSNIVPKLPPSLRPRPKGPDISEGFAPIVAAVKPAPPTAPASPATPASTPTPPNPALKKSYTPKPTPDRVPKLEGRITLFEGSFKHDSHPPFVVETPLTGNGAKDRQSLVNLARQKYPTGQMRLTSTRIFSREEGAAEEFPRGTTVGQLFGEQGSPTENQVEVAETFFQGEKCLVILRNLRARNSVTISLRPPGGNSIVFSNQVASNSPAHSLDSIIREILGKDSRELRVTIRVAK